MFLKCLALFLTKDLHVCSCSFSFRLVFVFEEISKKKLLENTGAISKLFAQLNCTCTDLNVCILFLNFFFFTIDNRR